MQAASLLIALSADTPREGEKGQWVHLMTTPVLEARDGRRFFLEDPQGVIEQSLRYAGATQIVVDYDHQSLRVKENGQLAPAAGWIARLEVRDSGIWGLVNWTPQAAAMLASRQYRYISPTFFHSAEGQVRVLHSAALTNTPALDLTPAALSQALSIKPPIGENDMVLPATILAALGLDAAANEDAILGTINQLKARAESVSPETLSAMAALAAETTAVRAGARKARVESKVEGALRDKKMPPALRDWALQLCASDEAAFDTFLAQTGDKFAQMLASPFTPELEASLSAVVQDGAGAEGFDTPATRIADQLGLSVAKLR